MCSFASLDCRYHCSSKCWSSNDVTIKSVSSAFLSFCLILLWPQIAHLPICRWWWDEMRHFYLAGSLLVWLAGWLNCLMTVWLCVRLMMILQFKRASGEVKKMHLRGEGHRKVEWMCQGKRVLGSFTLRPLQQHHCSTTLSSSVHWSPHPHPLL